jgi:peroxiredoxin
MMKRFVYLCLAGMLAGALLGQEFQVGSQVKDFTISNLQGNPVQYSALKGDITVVMFIATKCPVSNAYNERMKALYGDYNSNGVKFVFINSNSTEPATEVGEHAASHGFPFKVFKDPENQVADRFGATVTPEAFVMDKNGTIVYHGSIDDSQRPERIKEQRLRSALDEVLAGKTVAVKETKVFGCTIKRVKKVS